LLLFKFEIKQNVSNTNIVTNNIINRFKIISMAESMIWKTTNFDKFVVRSQEVSYYKLDKFR